MDAALARVPILKGRSPWPGSEAKAAAVSPF